MELGVGLWTMRATAAHPAAFPRLYAALRDDARFAEALGFHSLWLSEHHFWYDGWSPSPLVAAATVLAATTRLAVGTGVHLLPLHDPDRVATQLAWLQSLSQGRMEFGVGLGYRDAEFDGYGLSRRIRGRRMEAALELLAARGDQPRVWVGGFAEPALKRAGRHGFGVILPPTLTIEQTHAAIAHVRAEAGAAGRESRIGVLKSAWLTDGSDAERDDAVGRLATWTREYAGSWFPLKGRPGFESPELLDRQMERSATTALIGSTSEVVEQLRELEDAGAELCVLHIIGDGRAPECREIMERLSREVLPAVQGVGV